MKLVFALSLVGMVNGHSWIHCSDYRGDTRYYEKDNCFGHPRPDGGRVPDSTTFGVDIGYNEQPGEIVKGVEKCQVDATNYLDGKPMARYRPGQVITLAWPSKNHVAAKCTNQYIPDTSVELFVAPFDKSGHPKKYTQVKASFSDEPHVNGQMDFKGFQNCPAFCENMDKALCTGTFTVPDMADGVYTFQWNWEFNGGTEPYVTCFEAYVGKDVAPVTSPTASPTTKGQTTRPTPEPTHDPNADCVQLYGQCGGGDFKLSCCVTGTSCMKQSVHYSQCLEECPSDEWECSGSKPSKKPSREPSRAPKPTSAPTTAVTMAGGCREGYGFAGVLQKASGSAGVSATLLNGCDCAKFCTMFAPRAKAFAWKKGKCGCYSTFKRMKKKKSATSVVGGLPLAGFQWTISK